MRPVGRSRSHRTPRPPLSAPRTLPASPLACGTRSTTSPPRGNRRTSSNRVRNSIGSNGHAQPSGPADGYQTFQHSTSRIAPLTPGKEGCGRASRKDFFVDIDVTERAQPDSALRRRLLGIGLGGAAVSLLPFLAGRAGATTPSTGTGPTDSSSAATTTTAPQKRPTDTDVTTLGFAQSIEIAAFMLYEEALATDVFDDNDRAVLATLRDAHKAYAGAFSGFLGREAPQEVNPMFDQVKSSFGGDRSSILDAAYQLESTAVATHLDILSQLQGTDGAGLTASILIVEARHGTVIAYLNGSKDLDELLVTTEAAALTPAEG